LFTFCSTHLPRAFTAMMAGRHVRPKKLPSVRKPEP
jgi:hypothetical protein